MTKEKIKHLFRTVTKMIVLLIVLLIIIGCKPKQILVPINARRIINGLDKAELIAGYYYKFLEALNIAV